MYRHCFVLFVALSHVACGADRSSTDPLAGRSPVPPPPAQKPATDHVPTPSSDPPASGALCVTNHALPYGTPWLVTQRDQSRLHLCAVAFEATDNSSFEPPTLRSCITIDLASGALSPFTGEISAAPQPSGERVLIRDGVMFACGSDSACRPVGRRLANAARIEQGTPGMRISPDGKLAVLDRDSTADRPQRVWDVTKDRPLGRFPPPRGIERAYLNTGSFSFLGDMLVQSWEPCAGPCEVSRIYRRDGVVIVPKLVNRTGVRMLPDGRLAVMEESLEIYDPRRAVLLRTIELVPDEYFLKYGDTPYTGEIPSPLVPLDGGALAVFMQDDNTIAIAVVDIDAGKQLRRFEIPYCGSRDDGDD